MEEMKMKVKIITICLITLATCLTGCSSINPYTGEKQISRTTIGTGVGAAGGAIVGGLLGGGKGALIGAAAGGVFGGVTGNYMDRQNAELRQCLVGTGVQVRKQGNNIQLSMASDVTFKLNSADINSRFYTTLCSVATVLKKYSRTNIMVQISWWLVLLTIQVQRRIIKFFRRNGLKVLVITWFRRELGKAAYLFVDLA
jgi:hypothetical protein